MYGTYAINWYMHGVFGIEEAEWRQPSYARSMAELWENSEVLARFVALLLQVYGFNSKWLGYLIFTASTLTVLVMMRRDRLLTLYVCTPIILGLGLLAAYALITGINVPVRATAFHWFIAAFSLAYAVQILGQNMIVRAGMVAMLVLLCGFWTQREARLFSFFQPWQNATRDLSEQVSTDSERIVVFGHMGMIDGAVLAGIQTFDGLAYRLAYLTGKPTVICRRRTVDCSAETPPFDPAPRFGSTEVGHAGGVTYIRLPAIDRVP